MEKPATPRNEKERLAEPRDQGLLDSAAQARFDRFTRLAKRLFDVCVALMFSCKRARSVDNAA